MVLQIGQTLQNRYRIVKLLGQGGFGAVYRAWDTNLSRPCALKENLETSKEAQRQFAREATVLANLSHPNLPIVFDHFSIPFQGQYLVMDYIEGEDLEEMRRRSSGNIPEAQAMEWLSQICDALDYLHSQNPPVIHRDIKPANIKISPEGRAVLVDFGIVKLFEADSKTTMGARAITPGYSPPEQYGGGSTDARSDIYALGATVYALLTGVEPVESIQRSLGATMPSPEDLNPRISPAVNTAIMRAMEVLPTQRFSSVNAFKGALTKPVRPTPTFQVSQAAVFQPAVAAARAEQPIKPAKAGTPKWVMWGLGVAFVIVCFTSTLFGYYFILEPEIKRREMQTTQTAVALLLTQQWNPLTITPSTDTFVLTFTPSPLLPTEITDIPTLTGSPITAATPTNIRTPTEPILPTYTNLPPEPDPQVLSLSGDGVVRLTLNGGDDYAPQLSRDQRHLISFSKYGEYWHVMEIDPNGGGFIRQITSGSVNYHHPHFSPGGDRILVAADIAGNYDIYSISFETGEILEQFTNDPGRDVHPDWLPDMSGYIFMSDRDGEREIYLDFMDGSIPRQLTNNDEDDGSCKVSPDGRHIAFYSTRDGNPEIYLMELSTGDTRRLTNHSARDAEPAFSPDGVWIAFESNRGGSYDIWAMRLDGSGLHRVTDSPNWEQIPEFSPDGKWILYQGKSGNNYDLYRIPWQ